MRVLARALGDPIWRLSPWVLGALVLTAAFAVLAYLSSSHGASEFQCGTF